MIQVVWEGGGGSSILSHHNSGKVGFKHRKERVDPENTPLSTGRIITNPIYIDRQALRYIIVIMKFCWCPSTPADIFRCTGLGGRHNFLKMLIVAFYIYSILISCIFHMNFRWSPFQPRFLKQTLNLASIFPLRLMGLNITSICPAYKLYMFFFLLGIGKMCLNRVEKYCAPMHICPAIVLHCTSTWHHLGLGLNSPDIFCINCSVNLQFMNKRFFKRRGFVDFFYHNVHTHHTPHNSVS